MGREGSTSILPHTYKSPLQPATFHYCIVRSVALLRFVICKESFCAFGSCEYIKLSVCNGL